MDQLGKEWVNRVVSSGTLKVEELIPRYIEVLMECKGVYADFVEAWDMWSDDGDDVLGAFIKGDTVEMRDYMLDDLVGRLHEIAPEGCVFGASQGDGACFGFSEIEPAP